MDADADGGSFWSILEQLNRRLAVNFAQLFLTNTRKI